MPVDVKNIKDVKISGNVVLIGTAPSLNELDKQTHDFISKQDCVICINAAFDTKYNYADYCIVSDRAPAVLALQKFYGSLIMPVRYESEIESRPTAIETVYFYDVDDCERLMLHHDGESKIAPPDTAHRAIHFIRRFGNVKKLYLCCLDYKKRGHFYGKNPYPGHVDSDTLIARSAELRKKQVIAELLKCDFPVESLTETELPIKKRIINE